MSEFDTLTVYKTAAEIVEHRREPLLDYKLHYRDTVAGALEGYEFVGRGVALNGSNPNFPKSGLMRATEQRGWDVLKHLTISYCAGNPLDELRAFYPYALEFWEEYAKRHIAFHNAPEANGRRVPHLDIYDFDYERGNQLICFALLLGWAEYLPRLVPILDYENDVHDILWETYLRPFIPGRPEGTEYTRHLPYRKLQKVFDAAPEKRSALMTKYLDEWYHASRREGYYNQHGCGSFQGYWSWEAAAITWLFELDDSGYRDKPFYPADLVDYARAQYTPAQARLRVPKEIPPPKPEGIMRIEGGEQCPREGWWWSPADKESPRFFKRGEVTPIITSSTWGQSYWLWQKEGGPDK